MTITPAKGTETTTAVAVEAEQLIIKNTGTTCTVPENSWAKLMYYLNCVNSVINLDIPSKITNYNKYMDLTFDDKNYILMLAEVMSPSLFEENHVFIYDAVITPGKSNQFYDISYTKVAAAATKEFLVAGMRVATLKVMAYEYQWKKKYYDDPMLEFSERLNDIHYGKAEKYRKNEKSTTCLLI